jgi:hypothetical protein
MFILRPTCQPTIMARHQCRILHHIPLSALTPAHDRGLACINGLNIYKLTEGWHLALVHPYTPNSPMNIFMEAKHALEIKQTKYQCRRQAHLWWWRYG